MFNLSLFLILSITPLEGSRTGPQLCRDYLAAINAKENQLPYEPGWAYWIERWGRPVFYTDIPMGNSRRPRVVHPGAIVVARPMDFRRFQVQAVFDSGFLIGRTMHDKNLFELYRTDLGLKEGSDESLVIPKELFIYHPGREMDSIDGVDSWGIKHELSSGFKVVLIPSVPGAVSFVTVSKVYDSSWVQTETGDWFHATQSPWLPNKVP